MIYLIIALILPISMFIIATLATKNFSCFSCDVSINTSYSYTDMIPDEEKELEEVRRECIGEDATGTRIYRKVYTDAYRDINGRLCFNEVCVDESEHNEVIVHKNTIPTNCKNCGAILHSHKCEYCGSEYY